MPDPYARPIDFRTTLIRELELVKKKQPQIKTVYLVGRKSMFPLGGEGDRKFLTIQSGIMIYCSTAVNDIPLLHS